MTEDRARQRQRHGVASPPGEVQRALLDATVDVAVHSLKDLPTQDVAGLTLGAIPPREDSADALPEYRQRYPLLLLPAFVLLALTLLITLCGMFTTAFFLSRSYMIVLYLILALVVGNYVGARKRLPGLETTRMTRGWWRWVPAAMGSIAGLYVLVAILLRTAG